MAMTVFVRAVNIRNLFNTTNVNAICPAVDITQRVNKKLLCTTWSSEQENTEDLFTVKEKEKPRMSAQMRLYMDRAKQHEAFMQKQIAEYQIGLRHLANIMGEDPKTIEHGGSIKKCIEYLFPSGLYDKKAQPILAHPTDLFKTKKEAQFDMDGRPHHPFFYTAKPNFFHLLHELAEWYLKLNNKEDEIGRGLLSVKKSDNIDYSKYKVIEREELVKMLNEEISEREYEYFVNSLERLMEHTCSKYGDDFIMKYIKQITQVQKVIRFLPVHNDKNNRPYVKVRHCMRKSSRGTVIVYGNGSGNIEVNGEDLLYFKDQHFREQVAFPLLFTDMGDKVDIVAKVHGGGPAGQAGAIRWGISYGLLSFVTKEMRDKMKLAGLLQRDWRKRERKKFGQEGARRKFTWKKR